MRRGRRRRAIVMLALALACGGFAASRVERRERQVEARVGAPVPVLVARTDLPAGARLGEPVLAVREVPARYAPPDALASPAEASGLRLGAGIAAGGYVTAGVLESGPEGEGEGRHELRRRERAVEVAVAGGRAVGEAGPGARVDVVVTEEPRSGGGRSYLAMEDVEVLGLRPADEGEARAEKTGADTLATLRVTLRQAVFLAAANSFAREIRLLPRGAGERGSAGSVVAEAP
jgi:pilus assembly protein CpaB